MSVVFETSMNFFLFEQPLTDKTCLMCKQKTMFRLWSTKRGEYVVYLVTTWVIPCFAIIYECIVCPYSWQKAISGLGIMTAWFRPQRREITNAKHGCFVYIVETDLFDFNQITFGRISEAIGDKNKDMSAPHNKYTTGSSLLVISIW